MSWTAWSSVATAERRVASSAEHPLALAVAAAGHPVEVVPSLTQACQGGAGDVVWLAGDDDDLGSLPVPDGWCGEILAASYDGVGMRLLDLVAVMDRLRRECPWDREQTHRSLATYLLEETYETLEAIESGSATDLREELGDLLLQVLFHARIAEESAAFTIDDVAAGIVDKLVSRHPHVFAGLEVAGAEEVNANWERLKTREKQRTSVLDGVPMALPALALADKVLGRAARAGVAPREVDPPGLGDRLLAQVVEARATGQDPEQALRETVRALVAAVRTAESR